MQKCEKPDFRGNAGQAMALLSAYWGEVEEPIKMRITVEMKDNKEKLAKFT